MKYLNKIIVGVVCIAAFLTACDKADVVPVYKTGNTPILSSSASTIAASPSDSDNTVVTFTWTNPAYATDSSTVKYILEFDTSASFANPISFIITGALWDTLSGVQVNNLLLNTYGFKIGVPYTVNTRLVSSYANNNDQKISNSIALSLKAYAIPPKVTPPSSGTLFIIGDATQENPQWTNSSILAPTQQFDQIDSVTYGGVFYLNNTGSYLFIPVDNGDWTHKFGGSSANGGDILVDNAVPGSNTPAPVTAGWYTIIVNFQYGTYTITPFTLNNGDTFTGDLFIIGDATSWGWNQPVPTPAQQFVQDNSAVYHLTIPLISTGSYLLLPENGSYNKFAVANTSLPGLWAGGSFGSELGGNFPAPPTDGTYTITVNFATWMFSVK